MARHNSNPSSTTMPGLTRMNSTDRKQSGVAAADSSALAQPLLSSFELDGADSTTTTKGFGGHTIASPPPATLSPSTSPSVDPVIVSSPYYTQYEETVKRIRARRAKEQAQKETLLTPTPERTAAEYRAVAMVLSVVLLIVGLLIFFFYPRVPQWELSNVHIESLRLWSDGSAQLSLATRVGVSNANFVMTGIESVEVSVAHNGTNLGHADKHGEIKWPARTTSVLDLSHYFSPLSAHTFAPLFAEMQDSLGHLTLQYRATIITSENFRLRTLQVDCAARLLIDAIPVPPEARILSSDCSHTEQTG
jgi:hypothetical protein